MSRPFMALLAGVALSVPAGAAAAGEKEAWRLFVADHSAPIVRAIDAVTGEEIASFDTAGAADLHRSASGRSVFALQRTEGRIAAFASGLSFDDHGDHGDISVEAPKSLGLVFEGDRPAHFVEHDGEFAAFFDGEGIARMATERAILAGGAATRETASSAPHHGVAVPFGSHVLISRPNAAETDALPVGIDVVDRAGAKAADHHACPDLHGEAASGNIVALACASGLLIATGGADGPAIRHLPYEAGLPEGKVTTLAGGRGLQYFLGNYGPDAVVLIDPAAEDDAFRLIELPTRRVHFAVDPIRARYALVFTEDGRLHRIDVIAGRIDRSLKLTAPYSMDGHWRDPRPRIAVAGDRIFVTDPTGGRLIAVDAGTFQVAGEIAVDGRPFSIVAVGGAGEAH